MTIVFEPGQTAGEALAYVSAPDDAAERRAWRALFAWAARFVSTVEAGARDRERAA